MMAARCSDAQIIGILNQAEGGMPVSKLCRKKLNLSSSAQ